MRIRCPGCGAPYVPPQVIPPDVPQCPNCDTPTPLEPEPVRPRAEPTGARSRVVSVVAALHFLMAAGGICVGTGFASVAGDLGVTVRALAFLVIAGVGTFIWAGVGLGIQMRWVGAWYASLVICGLTLLYGLAVGVRSPCGAVYFCAPASCVLAVLIARRDEFR